MKSEYICFDIIDNSVDNVCPEYTLRDAKRYSHYLEVVLPSNNENNVGTKIGILDLTKKKT